MTGVAKRPRFMKMETLVEQVEVNPDIWPERVMNLRPSGVSMRGSRWTFCETPAPSCDPNAAATEALSPSDMPRTSTLKCDSSAAQEGVVRMGKAVLKKKLIRSAEQSSDEDKENNCIDGCKIKIPRRMA